MSLLKSQQAAEQIDALYQDLEDQLMLNIINHLKDWDQPIDSDRWLLQKLAEIGKLNRENIKTISRNANISADEAETMILQMAREAIENLEPGFKQLVAEGMIAVEAVDPGKSKNIANAINTLRAQAADTLNLTNTTMLHKAQEAFRGLTAGIADEAKKIMNNRAAEMITGAASRQQAMRKAIRQFVDKGITGFVDRAGREWSPEAYVNMCMRTTAKNVAEGVQTARCQDYGINLIAISSHSGARPKCAKDQGKIFDLNNGEGETKDLHGKKIKYYPWNSSSYGEPDGILGINCNHHKTPFVPGVNIHRYFPTEDFDENNRLYKQTQVQRALERDVRKQKRECMAYKQLGDDEAFEAAAVKLKSKEAKLKDYVDKHDHLVRRKNREEVVVFDKSAGQKAAKTAKKHHDDWLKGIGAESTELNTVDKYHSDKYNNTPAFDKLKSYSTAVKKGDVSPILGYETYEKKAIEIEESLIGLNTVKGIKVTGYSAHFVARVIGEAGTNKGANRKGVKAEDLKECLEHGMIRKEEPDRNSITIRGKRCIVSINPTTGQLIQTNPTKEKK